MRGHENKNWTKNYDSLKNVPLIDLTGNYVGQPDNAEYLLNPSGVTVEACLSINNDWYHDGIAWHDAACYHKKPFICEDSDNLMRRARNLSPNIVL